MKTAERPKEAEANFLQKFLLHMAINMYDCMEQPYVSALRLKNALIVRNSHDMR